MIVHHMESHCRVRNIPTSLPMSSELLPNKQIRIRWKNQVNQEEGVDDFDTVLMAVGRTPNTFGLGLEGVGVKLNSRTHKILGGVNGEIEQTNSSHIYALGDVLDGCPEYYNSYITKLNYRLTPIAMKSAQLLAQRLSHRLGKTVLTPEDYEETKLDYNDFPTTVFTPLEYSCVGLTEQQAQTRVGEVISYIYIE